jgi:hypothetical protein
MTKPVIFLDPSPEHEERVARLVARLDAEAQEGCGIVLHGAPRTEPAWSVKLYGPRDAWCIVSGPRSTEEVVARACALFFHAARPADGAAA